LYTHNINNRIVRIDIFLIDLLCLCLTSLLAYQHGGFAVDKFELAEISGLLMVMALSNALSAMLLSSYADFQFRGYYLEFSALFKQNLPVFALGIIYLFSLGRIVSFPWLGGFLWAVFYLSVDYLCRILWKRSVYVKRAYASPRSLLIVTDQASLGEVEENIGRLGVYPFRICGFCIMDAPSPVVEFHGHSVVCEIDDLTDYVCHSWVDDVLVVSQNQDAFFRNILTELSEAGVTIHTVVFKPREMLSQKHFVETLGGFDVMTSCMNEARISDVVLKRAVDILGALVGCFVTLILTLILGPLIKLKSPGPIFFKQKRVGRNGKIFNLYKFRSMYPDAEERKKEFLAANRVSDGLMFKMDFDPRIIGNEILPDGTEKTGIGNFIRVTSLDEFPQFFNVLKGDMSLVGTRPPTLDEWEKYAPHHRARLAIKPGITGMWQVSGRSKITDFEEVVALDTKYINEWSIGMDIRILLKTIVVLFRRDGAM